MEHEWLNSDTLLPDDAVLAELLLKHKPQPQVKSPVRDYEKEIRHKGHATS